MAYFANGTMGECFEDQCDECRYGKRPCPIALVQQLYNYDAVNNEVATNILNKLVNNDGTCEMFKTAPKDFRLTEAEKAQLDLF